MNHNRKVFHMSLLDRIEIKMMSLLLDIDQTPT